MVFVHVWLSALEIRPAWAAQGFAANLHVLFAQMGWYFRAVLGLDIQMRYLLLSKLCIHILPQLAPPCPSTEQQSGWAPYS